MAMGEGARYLGDLVYERLLYAPGFDRGEAQELISNDWRQGTNTFRAWVGSRVDRILTDGRLPGWGEFNLSYVERRLMEDLLDADRDPWLWAYATLVGACENAGKVRAALNGIRRSA